MTEIIYPIIGKQTALPFYLTGIGISKFEYHVKRDKGLISHQFLFTKAGAGTLIIDGKSYFQKKGCLFYLSPGIPHEYYPVKEPWTTYWIVFRGKNLSSIMETLGFPSWMKKENTNFDILEQLFLRILTVTHDSVKGIEKTSLLLYEFILTIRKQFFSAAVLTQGKSSFLENALIYINKNYKNDITLFELANLCNISMQHFCRIFKANIGMRPLEYIAQYRISKAKKLLWNSTITISDIGKSVGYKDLTYFGIVFKKYEGISPSKYRKLKGTPPL